MQHENKIAQTKMAINKNHFFYKIDFQEVLVDFVDSTER